MFQTIEDLIKSIKRAKLADQFQLYIDFIQYPFYRNIEINTRINFDFPLVVFIGQNGCGKSSTLHALYGSVEGKTPSDYWFETKVDPISYYDDKKRRHSFWYSYKDKSGNTKEVLKARIQRAGDPNYWETSRPLAWAGMAKGTRNPPIKKNVIYLDFRKELSAFDKFFYFGDTHNLKSKNNQEYLRLKSISLKKLFDEQKVYVHSSKYRMNDKLEKLDSNTLEIISYILGREYKSGKSLKHNLFRFEGYSILFETDFAKYSEAFAGSGEMAVARLVYEVLKAPNYSLILLDEPEVSLHPGAQERLKVFLLDQIKRKKHQIVITSHSPSIVNGLPKESIKVFFQNPQTGRFHIKENLLPEEAFFHIEFPFDNKKRITVEDKLAKSIIESVLNKMGEATASLVNVVHNPGGASVIKKEFISVFCRSLPAKDYVVLDGDQKILENHINWTSLSAADITSTKLQELIKQQTDVDVRFSVDGGASGSNDEQKIEISKKYLDYYLTNVFYLPGDKPEDIVWDLEMAKGLIKPFLGEGEFNHKTQELDQVIPTKHKFKIISEIMFGSSSSNKIDSVEMMFLKKWRESESESLNQIESIINRIIGRD